MGGGGLVVVLLAGTAARPSRDFAEVSLLVERQTNDLSGDLGIGSGEVEVTRRIERGAGSAYRVNGKDVRAKDVALLFAESDNLHWWSRLRGHDAPPRRSRPTDAAHDSAAEGWEYSAVRKSCHAERARHLVLSASERGQETRARVPRA